MYIDSGAVREDGCIACLAAERCEYSGRACGIYRILRIQQRTRGYMKQSKVSSYPALQQAVYRTLGVDGPDHFILIA